MIFSDLVRQKIATRDPLRNLHLAMPYLAGTKYAMSRVFLHKVGAAMHRTALRRKTGIMMKMKMNY